MTASVALAAIVIGVGMIATWSLLLVTHQVSEISERKRAIWFHLIAEGATALALIASGAVILATDAGWAHRLATAAFGSLLYTAINSPGYYADRGETGPVVMFGIFSLIAMGSLWYLVS